MRLLNSRTLQLEEFIGDANVPPYAKGLFVSPTEVPFTMNGTTVVKTPNTQSIVGPLIEGSVDFSTVPLTFCMATDQFSKKVNLIKINGQAVDFCHYLGQ